MSNAGTSDWERMIQEFIRGDVDLAKARDTTNILLGPQKGATKTEEGKTGSPLVQDISHKQEVSQASN